MVEQMDKEKKHASGSIGSNQETFINVFRVKIWSLVEEKSKCFEENRFWSILLKSVNQTRFKQHNKNGAFKSCFLDKIYPLEDFFKVGDVAKDYWSKMKR